MHNPALQPTANPLRGLPAAELGRYAVGVVEVRFSHEGEGCHSTTRGGWLVPGAYAWQPPTIQASSEARVGNGVWTFRR